MAGWISFPTNKFADSDARSQLGDLLYKTLFDEAEELRGISSRDQSNFRSGVLAHARKIHQNSENS